MKKFSISLPKVEKSIVDGVKEIEKFGKNVIGNLEKDIGTILQGATNCLDSMGRIGELLANRGIEYSVEATRIMINSNIILLDLVEYVWGEVFGPISKTIHPKLYKLNKLTGILNEVDVNSPNLDNNYNFLFVHGAFYDGSSEAAFSLYKDFESQAHLFKDTSENNKYADGNAYILAYDTSLTDDDKRYITNTIIGILGSNTEYAALIFAAIAWRELEGRAKQAGDYLVPFLHHLSNSEMHGTAVSHSLGCFALAHALQRYAKDVENEEYPRDALSTWLCMAAALPSNAFTNTGLYKEALKACHEYNLKQPHLGVIVWYSRLDTTLLVPYQLANHHSAMGVTGPLETRTSVGRYDVTNISSDAHESKIYFERLGPLLRGIFDTQ